MCWLPLFVYFPLAQFDRNSGHFLVGALIISLTVSNFNYVVNPFLYYKMLKQRPVKIPKVAVVVERDRDMNSSNNVQQLVNNDGLGYDTHL